MTMTERDHRRERDVFTSAAGGRGRRTSVRRVRVAPGSTALVPATPVDTPSTSARRGSHIPPPPSPAASRRPLPPAGEAKIRSSLVVSPTALAGRPHAPLRTSLSGQRERREPIVGWLVAVAYRAPPSPAASRRSLPPAGEAGHRCANMGNGTGAAERAQRNLRSGFRTGFLSARSRCRRTSRGRP